MRRTVIFLALFLASAVTFAASEAEKDVLAAVQSYREALLKKDLKTLDSIWMDDYTFINGRGELQTKADRMENLKSGATTVESIKHEDEMRIRTHGNVAIVMSHITLTGTYSGKPVSGQYRSTHIWVKVEGRWRLMSNQLTAIAK
jgi:ketosteroid isomerase-like protein